MIYIKPVFPYWSCVPQALFPCTISTVRRKAVQLLPHNSSLNFGISLVSPTHNHRVAIGWENSLHIPHQLQFYLVKYLVKESGRNKTAVRQSLALNCKLRLLDLDKKFSCVGQRISESRKGLIPITSHSPLRMHCAITFIFSPSHSRHLTHLCFLCL